MDDLNKAFKSLKKKKWGDATVSLYVVKRTLSHKVAHYKVSHVNTETNLRIKLRKAVSGVLAKSNAVLEYDFVAADLDGDVLGLDVDGTDFETILSLLEEDVDDIKGVDDLVKTWVYIVRLDLNARGSKPLYAVRKVSDVWTTKKVKQTLINLIFDGNMLVDLDQKEVFQVDGKIDFYTHDGLIFIADKKNFESAMNFRVGMEANRDVIVDEFKQLGIFEDAELIKTAVGNNLKRLRKLSQVKKSTYYHDKKFMASLKKVAKEEGWDIKYNKNGEIIVNEENIDLVLKVLNNDRLTSKINSENFDVDVKHKI